MMEIELDELSGLKLLLAKEQLNSANMLSLLKQQALKDAVNAVKAEYEEDGKYTVTNIDLEKMLVTRQENE